VCSSGDQGSIPCVGISFVTSFLHAFRIKYYYETG
jgi:hypothetical protein